MGGRLLGFDNAELHNSLGIAYAQCSGNAQANLEGALTVRLQQGLGARAGIMSLVLADEGFTGAKDILEGSYGLYPLYMHGQFDPEALTGALGKRFESSNSSIKPYPSCKFTHAAINSVLELAGKNKVTADDVDEITIHTSSYNRAICGGETKISPQTIPDAQFSYYYTVATALLKGKVFIEDFTKEAINDPDVLALARKVKVVVDPDKDKLQSLMSPTDIEIRTKDGKRYRKSMEFVKGHPKNPMSMAEVVEKFEKCARFSAKPLSDANISKVSRLVEHFEDLDDATVVLGCLT
jgi:2-methylcitrate dehydratase PrpD